MKLKKSFLICIILLAVFSIGIASAHENTTSDTLDEATPDIIEKSPIEDVLTAQESNTLELNEDYEVSIPSETYDGGLDLISVTDMPKYGAGNAGEVKKTENDYLHIKYRISDITYDSKDRFIWMMYFDSFVRLDEGVEGNIEILIDNETIYNNEYDDEIHIYHPIDKNAYGSHTYEVRYSNGTQKSVTKKYTFTIPICLARYIIDDGDSITFKLQLPEEGYGVARLGNKKYPFDFEGSDTYVTISGFSEGDNIIKFTFYDGKGYSETYTEHIYFTAELTGAEDITMQYSDAKTFTAKVYDIYGKQAGANEIIKIKIGKKTFTAKTDKNGNIKFKIPNTITPGKYNIISTYKNAKITKKLTVKQIITIKTIKVKKSAKKLTLTATLKKINGKYLKNKKITFKFNGKTFKAKTNSKGVAKVTVKSNVLKKLKAGKNVTYQATYLKDTVKKTVKVKK